MSDDQFRTPRGPRRPPRNLSSADMQRWEAEEEEAYYQAEQEHLEKERREKERAEQEREEEREAAVEEMVEWFFLNFEDPGNQTPRDDGEFVYIWGGPYDASDVIGSQFGDQFDEEWIDAAVEEVQKDGTYDWAPAPGSDFYDSPEDEERPEAPEPKGVLSRAALVQRLRANLDALEQQLNEIPASPIGLGHNLPPSDIGLPPYDEIDRDELREAAQIARQETSAPEPEVDRLSKSASTFRRVAGKIVHWLGKKADLAVDEAIRAGIKVGALTALAALLSDIAADLVHLIGKIVGFQ